MQFATHVTAAEMQFRAVALRPIILLMVLSYINVSVVHYIAVTDHESKHDTQQLMIMNDLL